jgi:hypothetical protein
MWNETSGSARPRLLALMLGGAALAGCGGPDWVKPGASDADREAAKERCSTMARAIDPAAPAAAALGDENPPSAGAACVGASYGSTANCAPSGLRVATADAGAAEPASPAAANQRAAAFEGCMTDSGFRLRQP